MSSSLPVGPEGSGAGSEQTAASAPIASPPAPPAAVAFFGDRLDRAEAYVALLAGSGSTYGLIGPREVPRLWHRHVLNCAVLTELVPPGSAVVDVGSGAGLPGIPLAIIRPDVSVTLVEPLLRRTRWLESTIEALGLANVTVRRGRAESFAGRLRAPIVTARAVTRLGTLATWCGPLVEPGGALLALKGESAAQELSADRAILHRAGFADVEIRSVGAGIVDPQTTVVVAHARAGVVPLGKGRRPAAAARARGRARRSAEGRHPRR